MEIFGFQTVENKPALFHPELDMIVISDIHLGLEGSMTSKGNYIPRFQLDELKNELEEIRQETGAEKILVNGDLKNQYSTTYTEKKETEEFLNFLKEKFSKVILIKGNHDTLLENTAEKKGLELKKKFVESGIIFTHGHESLEKEKSFEMLVIGHEHPALSLKDDIGVKEKVPCILYGQKEEFKIIVLPAYSKIARGSEINEMPREELLSPILRKHGLQDLKALAVSREAGLMDFPEISKIK